MKCTVYVNEYANTEGQVFRRYSIGVSKKINDKWYNNYIPVNFKKGVDLANKTRIDAKNFWLDFYINKEDKPVTTVFISEFEEIVQDVPTDGFQTVSAEDELPF